jgi:hypothetical protein
MLFFSWNTSAEMRDELNMDIMNARDGARRKARIPHQSRSIECHM